MWRIASAAEKDENKNKYNKIVTPGYRVGSG